MSSKENGPAFTDGREPILKSSLELLSESSLELLSGGFSADAVAALRQAARELKFSVKQLVEAGGQHPTPGGGLSEVKLGQAFIQVQVDKPADFDTLWARANEIMAQSAQQTS